MDDRVYILFSDGTWSSTAKTGRLTSLEDRIQSLLDHHWWPFPLDIKGDYRRSAIIIRDCNNIQEVKKI